MSNYWTKKERKKKKKERKTKTRKKKQDKNNFLFPFLVKPLVWPCYNVYLCVLLKDLSLNQNECILDGMFIDGKWTVRFVYMSA